MSNQPFPTLDPHENIRIFLKEIFDCLPDIDGTIDRDLVGRQFLASVMEGLPQEYRESTHEITTLLQEHGGPVRDHIPNIREQLVKLADILAAKKKEDEDADRLEILKSNLEWLSAVPTWADPRFPDFDLNNGWMWFLREVKSNQHALPDFGEWTSTSSQSSEALDTNTDAKETDAEEFNDDADTEDANEEAEADESKDPDHEGCGPTYEEDLCMQLTEKLA